MEKLKQFLTLCVDVIFPPSAELLAVRKLSRESVCFFYHPVYRDEVWTLTSYSEYGIRALIQEAKFHGNAKAFLLLNALLSRFLSEKMSGKDVVCIPIPLSSRRRRSRGYNQVHEVLRNRSLPQGVSLCTRALVRKRDTRPQTELSKSDRLKNMRDAFHVARPELIAGKHIVLVDDVITTGATMRAAKATLLPHSTASITCVALAH